MYKSEFFNVGKVVVTYGINDKMKESNQFRNEVDEALKRFCNKDWGDLEDDDKQTNEEALEYPEDIYLMGVYKTCKGKIWIITNRVTETAGDNATTVCFPDER